MTRLPCCAVIDGRAQPPSQTLVVVVPSHNCSFLTRLMPTQVLGDPDRLRGILLNLYTNAAKFTKRGAIALRVLVTGPNYRCVLCSSTERMHVDGLEIIVSFCGSDLIPISQTDGCCRLLSW